MKKVYISPVTEVLMLQAQQMLALSFETDEEGGDSQGDATAAWGRGDNAPNNKPNVWDQEW